MSQINVAKKIQEIYTITKELEAQFPGRRFTPDGHLVGSIGDVLVAEYYGLRLLPNSTETHDAISPDGKLVQIKATQVKRISLSSEPEHLIVISILENGDWSEVYNGPGSFVWNSTGKMQKNGQRSISLSKLRILMKEIPTEEKIAKN